MLASAASLRLRHVDSICRPDVGHSAVLRRRPSHACRNAPAPSLARAQGSGARTLVGLNMRPPRHMLPKAPAPAACVPPPEIRGMRETARPVPHDSAECCLPASTLTA